MYRRRFLTLFLVLFALCGIASAEVITVVPTNVTGEQEGISFVSNIGTGVNNPAYNTTSQDLRVYANGTFTVTSSIGSMTQIVFNLSEQGKRRLTAITSSTGSIASQALGDETVTWTGYASEVVFTAGSRAVYGSDGESKAGQFDFTSFDVTVGSSGGTILQEPELAFPATSYTIRLGEHLNAPVLTNPSKLPVTYSSNKTYVATVDAQTGLVTIKGVGRATITASFPGDTNYKAGSANYTIVVLTKDILSGYDYFYWFDNDYSTVRSGHSATERLQFEANLEGLGASVHTFHLQVGDDEGVLSSPVSTLFMKSKDAKDLTGYYWFDGNEAERRQTSQVQGTFFIDVSSIPDGFHTFSYQLEGGNGSMSGTVSQYFLKVPQTEGVEYLSCICYVDGMLYKREDVPPTGGIINWNFDVSDLSLGFHQLKVQIVTPSGAATATHDAYFLRCATTDEAAEMKCLYAIDRGEFQMAQGQITDGTYRCDLDVSVLSDGLHYVTYLLAGANGSQTKMQTHFFMKIPLGGSGLNEYQYWVNNDEAHIHKVKLDRHVDQFSLVKLLPVEAQPVRSSLFHFAIEDSHPVMYAKNELHIRFLDTSGRMAEATEQYTDYQKKKELTNIVSLRPNESASFDVPATNEISWFRLDAAPGDTLAFRLSQAATMQLFAPSGKEVFKTSESASVNWAGIHSWEEGTYYLAVHDVTGTRPTMTLDYMHMDKYDVVDWDVHTVGNGGCSTITFKGNGFRDLYAVDLYMAEGDTIKSVAIGLIDDANVSATYNFTDASIGEYDAVFHFTTENKKISKVVAVEEAKEITLALDVRYPNSFLSGTSTTYTITVTNKGNATAYDVPMEIYLSSVSSFANISSVSFKDELGNTFNRLTLDMIENDSIDDETFAYIDEIIKEMDGLQSFFVVHDSVDSSEYGFTDQLITIPPYSSSTFYVEVKSSSSVSLHVRIPSEWITVHSSNEQGPTRVKRGSASNNNLCCEKEKWECTVGIAADIIGLIPVAGCASGIVDLGTFTALEIVCADGNTGNKGIDFLKSIKKGRNQQSAIDKVLNAALGCVAGFFGKALSKILRQINSKKLAVRNAFSAMNTNKKIANEARERYYSYMKKYNEAFDAGDWDLANKCLSESDMAKKEYAIYLDLSQKAEKEMWRLQDEATKLEQELAEQREKLKEILNMNKLKDKVKMVISSSECVQEWKKSKPNCPPNSDGGGGSSSPRQPVDPNDIFGYLSEAGSKFIADSVAKVNYTIEFENDTTFAEASAHTIVIRDTLDSRYFDLKSFLPTAVKIGEREAFLDESKDVKREAGVTSFVKTIDMRPEIYAIAQVEI